MSSDGREQLLRSRRGEGVVEAGALSDLSGCRGGRGRMINISCTCVLVGLVPVLRGGAVGDGRSHLTSPIKVRSTREDEKTRVCLLPLTDFAPSCIFSQLQCWDSELPKRTLVEFRLSRALDRLNGDRLTKVSLWGGAKSSQVYFKREIPLTHGS